MPQPEISLNREKDVPSASMIETGQGNYLRPGIHVFFLVFHFSQDKHMYTRSQIITLSCLYH